MRKRLVPLVISSLLAPLWVAAGWALDRSHAPAPLGPATVTVQGLTRAPGESAEDLIARAEASLLDRPLRLRASGRDLGAHTLRSLGAQVDKDQLKSRIVAAPPGRTLELELPMSLPEVPLASVLASLKDELDHRPRAARRRIDSERKTDETTRHEVGRYVDVFATAEALEETARSGAAELEVSSFAWEPLSTEERVRNADVSKLIASFETRFGGAPGRNANIARAAGQLHGLVLMPGETVSFNETVGPRTVDNGFYPAPEIYKGEMREGIGGGACQVASTLYAASLFAGLEVIERRNHSRPSAYIRPGLDATVSYPVLDLRLSNPFDFAVVVSARTDGGIMRFELYGKERRVDVSLATETKGILKFSRKLERTRALPEGEFRVKQRGKRGLSLRRLLTTRELGSGQAKIEESTDVYPPTQEIYLVSPGLSPDALPPLEDAASGA